MNMQFKSKFLQHLAKKKSNKGFTLIELLVVVIIIGVLAAIALPNLLGQVAKGRQAEAKNNLGAVNRAQQAHRLEKAQFGLIGDTVTNTPGNLPVQLQPQYYDYKDDVVGNATTASLKATAKSNYDNDIKDYAASVGQTTAGVFSAIVCEAKKADQTGIGSSTVGTTCSGDSEKVE